MLTLPAECGRLSTEEIEMTNSDVESLLEAYRTRKWTVRQVVTAFLKRAVIMNQMVSDTTTPKPKSQSLANQPAPKRQTS